MEVIGYQEQSKQSVEDVNVFKKLEQDVAKHWAKVYSQNRANKKDLETAEMHFKQAFMWANRAVFQPTDEFEEAHIDYNS